MDAQQREPLWSDTRIADEIFRIKREKNYPLEAAVAVMPQLIRDSYEVRLNEVLNENAGQRHLLEHRRQIIEQLDAERKQLQARLAALSQAPPATEPLDIPDGPGWWGGKQRHREFVVKWTAFEVSEDSVHIRWDGDDYTITNTLSWFRTHYRDTKWYRLTMPWEQRPAPREEVSGE